MEKVCRPLDLITGLRLLSNSNFNETFPGVAAQSYTTVKRKFENCSGSVIFLTNVWWESWPWRHATASQSSWGQDSGPARVQEVWFLLLKPFSCWFTLKKKKKRVHGLRALDKVEGIMDSSKQESFKKQNKTKQKHFGWDIKKKCQEKPTKTREFIWGWWEELWRVYAHFHFTEVWMRLVHSAHSHFSTFRRVCTLVQSHYFSCSFLFPFLKIDIFLNSWTDFTLIVTYKKKDRTWSHCFTS